MNVAEQPSSLEYLSPELRPSAPFPRVALLLFAAAVPLNILFELLPSSSFADWGRRAAVTVAAIAGAIAGAWAEQRMYEPLARVSLVVRLAVHGLAFFFGLIASLVVGGVLNALLRHHVQSVSVAASVALYYVALASIGAALIASADVILSAIFQSFRLRVAAAIIVLVVAVTGVCLLGAELSAIFSEGIRQNSANIVIDGVEKQKVIDLLSNPVHAATLVFCIGFVLFLPTLISAAVKLADAVMDRIRPMAGGFSRVAAGDRRVRLEVGGSRDFKEVARSFNEMVERLSLAERMERAFGVYVSGHVLERIRAQHGEAALPPSLRDATVFFADIRGFTTLSEKLPPERVVGFLNRYFEHAVSVVSEFDGYLNKFIGDALVVVFNGPIDQPDHAERAVRCAVALQQKVRDLNAKGAFPEAGELKIGVGVATGPMTCGNVGSARQMEYTVIGDTVNLAARLTSNAPPGEVWMNEATARALPASVAAEALPSMKVKGKMQEVTPFRIAAA